MKMDRAYVPAPNCWRNIKGQLYFTTSTTSFLGSLVYVTNWELNEPNGMVRTITAYQRPIDGYIWYSTELVQKDGTVQPLTPLYSSPKTTLIE